MPEYPELSEIRSFVVLADAGSFSAASKTLDRDPTVLSRRLRLLEQRLGVRLAERTTRSFVLTEAGKLYLERGRALLQDVQAAGREVAVLAGGEPSGHLRIALPGSFARLWMGPILAGFLNAHPRITLEANYANQFVDVVGQGFDLAVRLAELPDSRLIARKVGVRRRLICAAPAYLARHAALTIPDDIAEHDCLCFTGRAAPFQWQFRSPSGDVQSISVRCRVASDDADLLVDAALAELGLFYTTDWHVGPLLASRALVEVLQDWPIADDGGIYILTPASVGLPSKTRAASDWIARELARTPWRAEPRR